MEHQPYREPASRTLVRTISLALLGGAILSTFVGGWRVWPIATVLMLWFTVGGHFLELWFLNWVSPRIAADRSTQMGTRVALWFFGGSLLGIAMKATAHLLAPARATRWPHWWDFGLIFIGAELLVHAGIYRRGQRSFYGVRG
jgi:hypothetical protein